MRSVNMWNIIIILERNHQGLGNRLLLADTRNSKPRGEIEYRERLGGMLKFYYQKAA